MATSPSSAAQAARERLGAALRDLRVGEGLSGVEFASRAGISSSMVSQIEHGKKPIAADHVRMYCRICRVSDRRQAELLGEQSAVANMWTPYAQLNRGGLGAAQKSIRQRYEELTMSRVYQARVVHGLQQTEAYTRAALITARESQPVEVDDPERDLAEAVAERMDRQNCLRRADTRWLFLYEEYVLRSKHYGDDVHVEQALNLLETMRAPNIVVGIIPLDANRRGTLAVESFSITDSALVAVELVTSYVQLTTRADIAAYESMWDKLWSLAVFGDRARTLINRQLGLYSACGIPRSQSCSMTPMICVTYRGSSWKSM